MKARMFNGSTFYNPFKDGVTTSVLSTWMECRELSSLKLSGWTPKKQSFALTFGTVVHQLLQWSYEDLQAEKFRKLPNSTRIQKYTRRLERLWQRENTGADKESNEYLETSLLYAEAVLPSYFKFWAKDAKLKWHALEGEFDVPLVLPDGRTVRLRGKRDGVFEYQKQKGLWLMEHKTKSRINEQALVQRLHFDQQVLTYLTTLTQERSRPIRGCLYNIIRRPGLQQRKTETLAAYAQRCAADVVNRQDFYFLRLSISVGKDDITTFDTKLKAMVWDFVQWWEGKVGHYKNTGACENKYGTCNMLPICGAGEYHRFFKRPRVFSELGGD